MISRRHALDAAVLAALTASGTRAEPTVGLDVNRRPFANVADCKDRVEAAVKVLEKTL